MSFTHYNAMKPLLLVLSLLVSFTVDAGGVPTRLCVQNLTAQAFNITGVDVDSYDWQDLHDDGAMNRPDHQFNNYTINPGDTRCVALDISPPARSPGFALQVLPSPQDSRVSGIKTRIGLKLKVPCKSAAMVCLDPLWSIDESGSSPSKDSGRLHGVELSCPDPKMEYHKDCRLFKITH